MGRLYLPDILAAADAMVEWAGETAAGEHVPNGGAPPSGPPVPIPSAPAKPVVEQAGTNDDDGPRNPKQPPVLPSADPPTSPAADEQEDGPDPDVPKRFWLDGKMQWLKRELSWKLLRCLYPYRDD